MLENPLLWISLGTLVLGGIGTLLMSSGQGGAKRPSEASDYGSHGSARWATGAEIRSSFATSGAGAVLGRLKDSKAWHPVIFPWDKAAGNRFILLIGPPGSGKTFTYPLPNLLHAAATDQQRSLVVTDPKIWASDRITELTAASDFDIREVGRGGTALYLIIPDHDSTYRVLSSLFFDQCFQQLIGLADEQGGRLPVECRLLLEEMANIGRIPDLEKRLATIRSRGLIVEMVLQTLGQLKALYGDAWSTILGCADTMLVLAANDLETARYVSRRLGTTTIRTVSQSSTQADRSESQGHTHQYTGRPLLTPEEVMGQGASGLCR